MIIDIHTHLFPKRVASAALPNMMSYCRIPYHSNGTDSDLLHSMKKNGVTAIVNQPVSTNPDKSHSLNLFASEAAKNPGIYSFGCVHPDMPDWKAELRRFRELGLIGLKIHNDYQGFSFDSKACMDIISAAYEENLMVLVHAGADPVSPDFIRCSPKMIGDAMPLLRQGTFIAAHLGGHTMLDDALRYVIGREVYIDTSTEPIYYPDSKCREVIEAHDPTRVLFGSDFPWDDQKCAIDMLHQAGLGDELLESILWKNTAAMFAKHGVDFPKTECASAASAG